MHDLDIRKAIHFELSEIYKDDPETKIVDELSLCQGISRIDVAVINGSMQGYEIKSDTDTLLRLPSQMEAYNKVFDKITIIAGECHLNKIKELVPEWWGLSVAQEKDETVVIEKMRSPVQNPGIDPLSLAQLLWKEEILEIMADFNLNKGLNSKPRYVLWEKLAEALPVDKLSENVRKKLKLRANWRSD